MSAKGTCLQVLMRVTLWFYSAPQGSAWTCHILWGILWKIHSPICWGLHSTWISATIGQLAFSQLMTSLFSLYSEKLRKVRNMTRFWAGGLFCMNVPKLRCYTSSSHYTEDCLTKGCYPSIHPSSFSCLASSHLSHSRWSKMRVVSLGSVGYSLTLKRLPVRPSPQNSS